MAEKKFSLRSKPKQNQRREKKQQRKINKTNRPYVRSAHHTVDASMTVESWNIAEYNNVDCRYRIVVISLTAHEPRVPYTLHSAAPTFAHSSASKHNHNNDTCASGALGWHLEALVFILYILLIAIIICVICVHMRAQAARSSWLAGDDDGFMAVIRSKPIIPTSFAKAINMHPYLEFSNVIFFSRRSDTKLFSLMSSETFHSCVRGNRGRVAPFLFDYIDSCAPTISTIYWRKSACTVVGQWTRRVGISQKSFRCPPLFVPAGCNCAHICQRCVCARAHDHEKIAYHRSLPIRIRVCDW